MRGVIRGSVFMQAVMAPSYCKIRGCIWAGDGAHQSRIGANVLGQPPSGSIRINSPPYVLNTGWDIGKLATPLTSISIRSCLDASLSTTTPPILSQAPPHDPQGSPLNLFLFSSHVEALPLARGLFQPRS